MTTLIQRKVYCKQLSVCDEHITKSVPFQRGVQAMSRVTTIPIFHSSLGTPWGTLILKCQNRGATSHSLKWQQQTTRQFTPWGGSKEMANHGPQADIWSCFLRQWIFPYRWWNHFKQNHGAWSFQRNHVQESHQWLDFEGPLMLHHF